MLTFTPKSDEELQLAQLIPAKEICEFEVLSAEHKTSSNGNPMIQLGLKVFYKTHSTLVFDFLMTSSEKMEFKLKRFCKTTGLMLHYDAGRLKNTDCVGKFGSLKIGVQEDKNGQYPPKNVVSEYLLPESHNLPSPTSDMPQFDDDDMPPPWQD